MENKIIGVIGGMGPHASNRFLELFYGYKKFNQDNLYPRVILDSNTTIPSRTRAVIYKEKSPLNGMIESANKLYKFGVNAIALPCNTAHIWINKLQKKIKIPIFNIIDIVREEIEKNYLKKKSNIYIFGTKVTTKKKLYIKQLKKFKNLNLIRIKKKNQKEIEKLIYLIKKNNYQKIYLKYFYKIIRNLQFYGDSNLIILACTELSYFKNCKFKNLKIIDSNSLLAEASFKYCKNKYDFFENNKIDNFWVKRSKKLKKKKLGLLQSTMLTNNEFNATQKDKREKYNVMKKIKKFISNKTLLEAGCGTGRWTTQFLDHAKSIDAYEKNSDLINFAEQNIKKNTKVKFINKSITNINTNKKFQVIISIALLHYLNNKEYNLFMENIKKCSLKNTVVIFRESTSFSYDFELYNYYSSHLKTTYSAHYRSSKQIRDSLGPKFKILEEKKIFEHEKDKPETYQNLIIFKKIK